MKLLTNYSDVNENLYFNFFLKSEVSEYNIIWKKLEQKCKTGEYMTDGWNEITKDKMIFIKDFLLTSQDDCFLYSDPDVVFLKKSKEILINLLESSNCDILFQNDECERSAESMRWPYNTGFFISKINNKVLNLFQQIVNCNFDKNQDDQIILNMHICDNTEIKVGFLPKLFYNYNLWRKDQPNFEELEINWNDEIKIKIPEETIAFHANWTKGISNKEKLLNSIKM